jgi:hypothetical protein
LDGSALVENDRRKASDGGNRFGISDDRVGVAPGTFWRNIQ